MNYTVPRFSVKKSRDMGLCLKTWSLVRIFSFSFPFFKTIFTVHTNLLKIEIYDFADLKFFLSHFGYNYLIVLAIIT